MTRNERRLVIGIVALLMVLTYVLSTNMTLNPNYEIRTAQFNANYFREQASSMLDGRLDVPDQGYEWTECHFPKWPGKCYGYFGLTQSVLRIPVVLVAGGDRLNLTPVFITLAAGLAIWAVLDLLLRVLRGTWRDEAIPLSLTAIVAISVALMLGPGSTLTFLAAPHLYHESIIAMIAYLLVAMNFVHRWIEGRRSMNLLIAVIAATAAAGARPSAIFASIVLGAGVLFVLWRDRRTEFSRTQFGLAAALAVLPGFLTVAILWMKFGAISPSVNSYPGDANYRRLRVVHKDHMQGFKFFFTCLANYLRPDSVGFVDHAPWFVPRVPKLAEPIWISPIGQWEMNVETTGSLTNTMLLPLTITVSMIVATTVRITRLSRNLRRSFTILILAGAATPLSILTIWAISNRYLGDFYPMLAIGTIFGAAALAHGLRRRSRAFVVVFFGFSLLALISFYIQLQFYGQLDFTSPSK